MSNINCVYILTTQGNTALYVGVTSNLSQRIEHHKQGLASKHTAKYKIHKLVYAETFEKIDDAIRREKCIKKWNREWKIKLIEKSNPEWKEVMPF